MGEFPGSQDCFVDENRVFIDQNTHFAIVLHKTASAGSAMDQGKFFQVNPGIRSVHYVVGYQGEVVQCVYEKDGAGGNCCLENGYDPFWDSAPTKSNLNFCTLSIEHCDASSDNSSVLTEQQKQSSFKLVSYLMKKYHIALDHIKGHNSISPLSRARCPGNYPWDELFTYLKGEIMAFPLGWHDDGNTLTASNGQKVVLGFRTHIENSTWDPENVPLAPEYYPPSVEESNIPLGPGTVQIFRDSALGYTTSKGVFTLALGNEYEYVKADRDNCKAIIKQLQDQIASLQQGVPSTDIASLEAAIQKVQADLAAFKK